MYDKLGDTGIADDRVNRIDSVLDHLARSHNGGYIERVR